MFYAESWLLTHLLFSGDEPVLRQRFGNFTPLLRAGENPVQAFTNALGLSLPQMEAQLQRYLAGGQFAPKQLPLPGRGAMPQGLLTRPLTPVENYFRLGDELLRINQLDEAERYFTEARQLAPASPLPYEGLGLLAIRQDRPDEALSHFRGIFATRLDQLPGVLFLRAKKYRARARRLPGTSQDCRQRRLKIFTTRF